MILTIDSIDPDQFIFDPDGNNAVNEFNLYAKLIKNGLTIPESTIPLTPASKRTPSL